MERFIEMNRWVLLAVCLFLSFCLFCSCQTVTGNLTSSLSGSPQISSSGSIPASNSGSSQATGSDSASESVSPSPAPIETIYEKPQTVGFDTWSDNVRPSLVAFVYNSLYSVRNAPDLESAIDILSCFEYLVCAHPGNLVEKERIVADAIKDTVKLFGYINLGGSPLPSLDQLKSKLNAIKENGWYGVFIDQFGYDFEETRARQNELVNYAHGLGLVCFANAWFIDDALGAKYDAVHNPDSLPSALGEDDWYLLESFYTGANGYAQTQKDFFEKIQKAQMYKEQFRLKIACLSYKRDTVSWTDSAKDMETSYLLAALAGFDGWWFTDHIEYDTFLYGDPTFQTGYRLTYSLYPVIPGVFWAQTDSYLVMFDTTDFPSIKYEVYDVDARSDLLHYVLQR
jgi:hypothetical protein